MRSNGNAVNNNLKKLFITTNFSPVVGVINGNSIKSITFDVSVEGYTPIGFQTIAYASGLSACSNIYFGFNGNNATLFFRNNSSNPTTEESTAHCVVNYIRKEFV